MKYFFSIVFFALLFAACSDDDVRPTASLNTAPTITSPTTGGSYALKESEAANIFEPFTWTEADFGFNSAISYKLEVDRVGNNFASALPFGNVNDLELNDVTIGKLNGFMIGAFGIVDTVNATPLEFRVCASVSTEIPSLCSAPITLNIVPFPDVVIYDSLSIPGSYQGWDPASRETIIYSRKNDGVYSGYVYIGEDDALYKFATGWSWDVNWGDDGNDGTLEPNGADIPIDELAGMYYIECDLNQLSHYDERRDWGVLGSATPTGDASDTKLAWDADRKVLTVTLDLSGGELRFRANDNDALNLGDNFANGKLEVDGAGIEVTEAGNYTIDLNLSVGDYTYVLNKN